jgi:4-oxalocrotonate tautomerase
MTIANCEEKSISVAIEEIDPAQWVEKIFRPDILNNDPILYKKPGSGFSEMKKRVNFDF